LEFHVCIKNNQFKGIYRLNLTFNSIIGGEL
jgi:hypothetical protein